MVLAVADRIAEQAFSIDHERRIGRRLENARLVAFAGNWTGGARTNGEDVDQAVPPEHAAQAIDRSQGRTALVRTDSVSTGYELDSGNGKTSHRP
jgi:hypothetical protein